MVHSVVTHIASLFRSARGLELPGQRETSFPRQHESARDSLRLFRPEQAFPSSEWADVPRAERDELIRF